MFNNKRPYTDNEIHDATIMHMAIFNNMQEETIWTGSQFQSIPFKRLLTEAHSDKPVYYAISTFNGKPSTKRPSSISREDDNFHALRAIVLDDIGTKVDARIIDIDPTFIVETSEKNYQYVYVLEDPITDKTLAKRIMQSFKKHKPVIGDLSCFTIGRIARLPLGVNGKELDDGTTNMFRPRLAGTSIDDLSGDPQTFTWHDILLGLGVTLQATETNSFTQSGSSTDHKSALPTDDLLYVWLKENKHIPYDQPDTFEGYANVVCPREHEHSNRSDSTVYDAGFSPNDVTQPGRQFKCHHSHDGNPPTTGEFVAYYENLGAPTGTKDDIMEGFDLKKNGEVKPHFNNTIIALNKLDHVFRYNSLSGIPEIDKEEMSDHTSSKLRVKVYNEFNQASINGNDMVDAMTYLATENSYNPAKDFFDNLPKWDGIERAETIFIDNLMVADSHISRIITRKWLLAVIYRTYIPGYKFDHALFLTGAEGTGKSSIFTALAVDRDWFCELTTVDEKLVAERATGSLIVELTESIALTKHETEDFKRMLSSTQTKLRLAYGRLPTTIKVSYVFCGCSNKHDFLTGEQNGTRRIWPLRVGRRANDVYDYVQFIKDVPQIYAEVKSWYDNKELLDIPKEYEHDMAKARDEVIAEDIWEQDVVNYLDGYMLQSKAGDMTDVVYKASIRTVCEIAIGDVYANFGRGSSGVTRIKAIMEKLPNWKHNGKSPMKMPTGVLAKGWRRVDENVDSYGQEFLKE